MEPIEKRIRETTKKLVYEYGNENLTMRDIASRCNISPGNLTYYFKKKEDLFAVVYEEILLETFHLFTADNTGTSENPWIFFIAANYAHLKEVVSNELGITSYLYATHFPSARASYVRANGDLLYNCLQNTPYERDRRSIHLASMIGCGGEFEIIYTFSARQGEDTFEELIIPVFKARMLLLGVDEKEISHCITEGMEKGKLFLQRAT